MSSDEALHEPFGSSDKPLQGLPVTITGLNNVLNVTAETGNAAVLILLLLS